jgi:3',5'-cyclic-AMP phosphodiesterase
MRHVSVAYSGDLRRLIGALLVLASIAAFCLTADGRFTFVILGDRTGEAQPGVYEQVWQEAAAEHPAFLINVGDTIEGGDDAKAAAEWAAVQKLWQPYREYPLYLVPGNHDIWSAVSEQLFRKYAGHPAHYSFDFEQAHFTVLDNSRSEELSTAELDYLESDLKAHAAAPVKLIFSHRPSWLMNVGFRNSDFRLHRLAKQYGVQYVVAGHIHQMLRFELEGVNYISVGSSGGHLRLTKAYADGWFFGHVRVEVKGSNLDSQIEELNAPLGQGRISQARDWGMTGLVSK